MSAPQKQEPPVAGKPTPNGATASVRAWLRLLQVHKAALGLLREELSGEVTLPRFDLLASLHRDDGQTLVSLSRHMLVTAGNVTGLVDRAERDGLLARRSDPGDRRATRVHLTRRGRKLYDAALSRHARRVAALFRSLDGAELETLTALLDRVHRDAQPEVEPEAPARRAGGERKRPAATAAHRRAEKKSTPAAPRARRKPATPT